MRMLDLFSGIGGFHLAAEWTWGNELDVVAHCEKDKYCQKVLKKHWPDVPIIEDIYNLTVDINGNPLYINEKGDVIMGAKRLSKYDESVNMYSSGLSIQDCAEYFGITRQAMHNILKRRNVVFRSNLKYHDENHFYRGGSLQNKRVQHLVEKAIKKGILKQKPCEICNEFGVMTDGRINVQAHHDDYNKPLDVTWLCQKCHFDWHTKNKAKGIENGENSKEPARGGSTIDLLTGGFP